MQRARPGPDGYLPLANGPPADLPSTSGRQAKETSIRKVASKELSRAFTAPSSQVPAAIRQKDKFVPLPGLERLPESLEDVSDLAQEVALRPGQQLYTDTEVPEARGRITVYCIADSLDRKQLEALLEQRKDFVVHKYTDVVHVQLPSEQHEVTGTGEAFFFDYGVICFWGLNKFHEQTLINQLARKCERQPVAPDEVDVDQFEFNYSAYEPPHIQNDIFTINKLQASDHRVRLAISHALAQSTKLSVYEDRVSKLVDETRYLPQALAQHGKVAISTTQLAKLIGKVFLQSSTVNLLSSVLDTPEFFWSAPDALQALYERACEYLELETRVEVLNARFQVLQEMLDMLRDHQNNAHAARLEWIIIWLLVVDVILMLFQLLSLFGIV